MTSYAETLTWLYSLEAKLGMDFRLERVRAVLARLGDPQRGLPAIHIAGTNGKGSTAAMLHSVYSRAGYRCGLYTSPHLVSFRERIRIGDSMIEPVQVVTWNAVIQEAAQSCGVHLTFFEVATVMALLELRAREVDLAVVEVGLGGRLDATNVVDSVASVITTVGLDHCNYLGNTLAQIAAEKAGILRPRVPLFSGLLEPEAERAVATLVHRLDVPWLRLGVDFHAKVTSGGVSVLPGLRGPHQQRNAALAAAIVRGLSGRYPVGEAALAEGLAEARWPGRLECLAMQPHIVVDAAHNPQGMEGLCEALPDLGLGRPWVLVFGVMADKDWPSMVRRVVAEFDRVVCVPVAQNRALDPRAAAEVAGDLRPTEVAATASEGLALARTRAGAGGAVVITGSVFLVGELYREAGGGENPFVGRDAFS